MTTRHSPYCSHTRRKDEAICACGHPLCLHMEIMPGVGFMGRYTSCRSRECSPAVNQECDSFEAA
ncbi:MAG: hypothetical protein Q8R28_10735, partial [Dehalococcoidia bacterium]|nr:hypothetical protein [Dehalococcoidia bacterium]